MSTDRIQHLTNSLSLRLNDPSIAIQPYREGVDCWVDLVSGQHAPLSVVRSAKNEISMTQYDGIVDFGSVFEKETALARLLQEAEVPTPTVLKCHRSLDLEKEPSWMLLEYVQHDLRSVLSPSAQFDLGKIVRKIHSIEPSPAEVPFFGRTEAWEDWICQRILKRITAAGKYMQVPNQSEIERLICHAKIGSGGPQRGRQNHCVLKNLILIRLYKSGAIFLCGKHFALGIQFAQLLKLS